MAENEQLSDAQLVDEAIADFRRMRNGDYVRLGIARFVREQPLRESIRLHAEHAPRVGRQANEVGGWFLVRHEERLVQLELDLLDVPETDRPAGSDTHSFCPSVGTALQHFLGCRLPCKPCSTRARRALHEMRRKTRIRYVEATPVDDSSATAEYVEQLISDRIREERLRAYQPQQIDLKHREQFFTNREAAKILKQLTGSGSTRKVSDLRKGGELVPVYRGTRQGGVRRSSLIAYLQGCGVEGDLDESIDRVDLSNTE